MKDCNYKAQCCINSIGCLNTLKIIYCEYVAVEIKHVCFISTAGCWTWQYCNVMHNDCVLELNLEYNITVICNKCKIFFSF